MPSAGSALKEATREQKQLPVWLTHLWQRRSEHDRLGLVLGAGVSTDAGIPMWEELIKRLTAASDLPEERMAAHRKAGLALTILAEIVYRRHSNNESTTHSDIPNKFQRYQINSAWRNKIHRCLYEKIARKQFSTIAKTHIYLSALAELIFKSRFAVTFNFDDIVDEAVIAYAGDKKFSNPEIITRPKIETRKGAPVIYHINGILPREELRRSSEHIVLTEDAFADILLSPNSQDAEFMINQFSIRTFLLLGVSLSDNSLKNLLRSGAKRNPANHHFIIYYEKDDARRSKGEREDIFDVNLNVYNLISIFLTKDEINAFLEMLNLDENGKFESELRQLAPSKIDRKYYLVGSIAAGKSSTLEALRCFTTHEEWTGRVPAAMYRNDKTLTKSQQKVIDDFLFPQLTQKNKQMVRTVPGIRVMDRAYLDLFAFSKDADEVMRKAKRLKTEVAEWGSALEDGQIFFLKASKGTLEERLARRGILDSKEQTIKFDANALLSQESELLKIYKPSSETIFDTSDATVGETAQSIARMILLGKYSPFDFSKRIDEVIALKGVL